MAIASADDALTALVQVGDELVIWQKKQINEADTRAKIIDRILKEVLGWDESCIRRETRTENGEYEDYFVESDKNKFILEAKRAGAYFDIPHATTLRARRQGLLARAPALSAALRQVVAYCTSRRIPVGVVSNGLQIAITMVFPVGNGYDTLLLNGFDRISADFVLFWDLLSPSGNCEQRLREILEAPDFIRPSPQFSQRLLARVPLPDESIDRNSADIAIAPVITRFFSDLISEGKEGILQKAYVDSERQAQYGKQIDSLLADRTPQLGPPTRQLRTTKSGAREVDAAIGAIRVSRDSRTDGNVMLFVGGVGSGKTTFEHRYFRFLADDDLRDSLLPLFLDFTKTSEESNFGQFVDDAVINELETTYEALDIGSWATLQAVYGREINQLRRGVYAPYWQDNRTRFMELISDEIRGLMSNREAHVQRLVEYLQTTGKDVCVVFDNVDQLGQEFQHRAIRLAYQKCRLWRCSGILSLREETYWRFRSSPPLDAFIQYTFHIAAPRIANVLSKRLELAKAETGGQSIALRSEDGSLRVSGVSIGEFLQVIVTSFLGEYQGNVILLESLSANDVRLALDMFNTFLRSGHTNTDEYIKALLATGSYTVPFHHLLRSIALGERRYYDASKSRIANLFSIEDDGFYSHFQKIRVLRYLLGVHQIDRELGRGFTDVSRLYRVFQSLVTDEEGLRRVLDPLLKNRLVEAANGYSVGGEDADLVRITAAGGYYLATLLNEFSYLDLVSIDTPIKSRQWFEVLEAKAFTPRSRAREGIGDRVEKVRIFLNYLMEEETGEDEALQASGLPEPVRAAAMAEIISRFEEQVAEFLARARWYGREIGRDERRGDSPPR